MIPFSDIVPLTTLTTKLVTIMESKGVLDIKDSTKKHVRRRLENEFGDSLLLFPDSKGKILVMPSGVNLTDLARSYYEVMQEVNRCRLQTSNINKSIDQASLHIRKSVRGMADMTKWPYHPSDNSNASSIPAELKRFLVGLFTGKPDLDITSQRIHVLIESLSQDIIYAVTNGQNKPVKHLLLSYGVKTLTGNVELIQMLNRLGHGVSYDQLEENDTALCLQKLATSLNQRLILPHSIQPFVFTNLAWDNIDRLQETLTGSGTTQSQWYCCPGQSVWSSPSQRGSACCTKIQATDHSNW